MVCYDFRSRIYDEKELMFATKLRLFSIRTNIVLTSIWLIQPIKLITSVGLNLVEQIIIHVDLMSQSSISSYIPIEPIFVLHVKIVIPPDTFK